MGQSTVQPFNFCETLLLKGRLLQVHRRKSGRYSSFSLETALGPESLKVSKYFRVRPDYSPTAHDVVLIKVLRKVKAGKETLQALEMRPLSMSEGEELNQELGPLSSDRQVFELLICQSKACVKRGAQQLMHELSNEAIDDELNLQLGTSSCLGQCKIGPAAEFPATGKVVTQLTSEKIKALLSKTSDN